MVDLLYDLGNNYIFHKNFGKILLCNMYEEKLDLHMPLNSNTQGTKANTFRVIM